MTQLHENTYESNLYDSQKRRHRFLLDYSPTKETLILGIDTLAEEIHVEKFQWEAFVKYLRSDISENPREDYPNLFLWDNLRNNDTGIKEPVINTSIINSLSQDKIITELNDKNVQVNFNHVEVSDDGYCMFRAILAILEKDSSWADKKVKNSFAVYDRFAPNIDRLNKIAADVCDELEHEGYCLSNYPLLSDFKVNVIENCFRNDMSVIYSPKGIYYQYSESKESINEEDNYLDYLSLWANSFAGKVLKHYDVVMKIVADNGSEFWVDKDRLDNIASGYVVNVNGNHYHVRLPVDKLTDQ
ncbi:TPA: hypothetical protein JLK53_002846 [Escherichia coli]|nr:hypothetical protein [Escherichia coli]